MKSDIVNDYIDNIKINRIKDMEKYDLTWIIDNMEPEWVKQEPETFIELVKYMKSELDRRKNVIQLYQKIMEDIL